MQKRKSTRTSLLIFVLMFIVVSCLITGCSKKENEDEIVTQYYTLKDELVSVENAIELKEYIDSKIKKASVPLADFLLNDYTDYITNFPADRALTGEEMDAIGLRPLNAEGLASYRVDYPVICEMYAPYISEDLYELYRLFAVETVQPLSADASMLISWDQLLNRAYHVEQYIQAHQNFELSKTDAKWLYNLYATILMNGLDNTPAFAHEDGSFSEDLLASYRAFIEEYPSSNLAYALNEYIQYLESIAYTVVPGDEEGKLALSAEVTRILSELERSVLS